jgi:hypothetical protein
MMKCADIADLCQTLLHGDVHGSVLPQGNGNNDGYRNADADVFCYAQVSDVSVE